MTGPSMPQSWRVTGTTESTDVDASGSFVKGVTVTFTTGRGHQGSVFIPLVAATPAAVRAAIDARVSILDGIATLASDGG